MLLNVSQYLALYWLWLRDFHLKDNFIDGPENKYFTCTREDCLDVPMWHSDCVQSRVSNLLPAYPLSIYIFGLISVQFYCILLCPEFTLAFAALSD